MKKATFLAIVAASIVHAQAVTFYTNPTELGSPSAEAEFIATKNQGVLPVYLNKIVNPGSNPGTYNNGGAVMENAGRTSPFNVIYNFTRGSAFTATISWNLSGTGYQMQAYPNSAILVEGAPLLNGTIPYAIYTPSPSENLMSEGSFTAQADGHADSNIVHVSFFGLPTSTLTTIPPPSAQGGTFVIGDNDAIVGQHVTFWGAKWAKRNSLSGGLAPKAFKGFATGLSANPPFCGGTWSSGPGRTERPPTTLPFPLTVIVASSITRSGSVISGNIAKMATVMTDPGYGAILGHPGTGTVVSISCTAP
jgi:hypothetical protein